MDEFLEQVYGGNTVKAYLIAIGAIMLTWVLLRLVKKYLIRLLKNLTSRTSSQFDDLLIQVAEKFIIPYLYLTINYGIINQLYLSARATKVLEVAMLFITTWYAVRLINFCIQRGVHAYFRKREEPIEREKQLNGILMVVKAIVWIFGIVLLIDNLGYNVTTIIAGLGVGGIAIALAAQNILSDLFSYLVIFFDKPFEIGDFITTNGHSGSVEKIGIKTSHLRSPDGQQLVMPNAELVKSVIHNYKRQKRRRIVFRIGVVYSTPAEKIRKIPGWIRELVQKENNVTFDRTHLVAFGSSSLDIEIVYFLESADFMLYMDTHHRICLHIIEKFEQEGIEFAFPTQTIYLNNEEKSARDLRQPSLSS